MKKRYKSTVLIFESSQLLKKHRPILVLGKHVFSISSKNPSKTRHFEKMIKTIITFTMFTCSQAALYEMQKMFNSAHSNSTTSNRQFGSLLNGWLNDVNQYGCWCYFGESVLSYEQCGKSPKIIWFLIIRIKCSQLIF